MIGPVEASLRCTFLIVWLLVWASLFRLFSDTRGHYWLLCFFSKYKAHDSTVYDEACMLYWCDHGSVDDEGFTHDLDHIANKLGSVIFSGTIAIRLVPDDDIMFISYSQRCCTVRKFWDFTFTRVINNLCCPAFNFNNNVAWNTKSSGLADWREAQ